jgi:hypothetical protein
MLKLAYFLSSKHVFMTGQDSLFGSDRCEFCAIFLHLSNTTFNRINASGKENNIEYIFNLKPEPQHLLLVQSGNACLCLLFC